MPAAIEDLIISLEAEYEQEKRDRERSLQEVRNILASARGEGRSNLTTEEDDAVTRAEQRADDCKKRAAGVKHRLDIAQRTKMREMETDEELRTRSDSAPRPVSDRSQSNKRTLPAYDHVARIGQEERIRKV